MPSTDNMQGLSASTDLGLGTSLSQQVSDETEEEKRKKRLGLSTLQSDAARMLLGNPFGSAGAGKI